MNAIAHVEEVAPPRIVPEEILLRTVSTLTAHASPIVYVDTSVIVAAFARDDPSSERARTWLAGNTGEIVTSTLTEVEVQRSLARQDPPRVYILVARKLLRSFHMVEVSSGIRTRAFALKPADMRSSDAIHVATALVTEVGQFATFDERQRAGVEENGIAVAPL